MLRMGVRVYNAKTHSERQFEEGQIGERSD